MEKHCNEKHPSTVIKHAGKPDEVFIPKGDCCCGDACDVCGGCNCVSCAHPPE